MADFLDGYNQAVKISYDAGSEEIFVYLVDPSQPEAQREPVLRQHLKLLDFVKLDNGSAYLGFCQETIQFRNVVLIESWRFESQTKANLSDPWSGLSLDYKCEWPKHLILSADALEKYNTLFRFLFPIKRVQVELQNVWAHKFRQMKQFDKEPFFKVFMQLRQHMSFLVDNIYSYLQTDVIEG
jgi:hypothetical protein